MENYIHDTIYTEYEYIHIFNMLKSYFSQDIIVYIKSGENVINNI